MHTVFVFGLEKGSGIFLSRNYDSAWLYCISNYFPAFNLILLKSCWKDCLDLSQLGFWPGYETKILVDYLWWDWNKGTQPSWFLLNLLMAFKTINHKFQTPAPEVGGIISQWFFFLWSARFNPYSSRGAPLWNATIMFRFHLQLNFTWNP